MEDHQLRWVHENRKPRRRISSIGEMAERYLSSPALNQAAWRREVLSAVQTHLGPALLQQAEVVDIRNGELILHVLEPALLYHLRLKYEQQLLDVLHAVMPGAGVHRVRFTTISPR